MEIAKSEVEAVVDKEIEWTNSRDLEDLALYIRAINGSGMSQKEPIAYFIQATAREEISGAVSADLVQLELATKIISILVLLIAIIFAYYITTPLRKVTSIASTIGSVDLNANDSDERIRSILTELPTQRLDETGELAKRFQDMIEKLLMFNNDLKSNQKELKQAKDTLDMRVQLKTQELERETLKALSANETKTIFLSTISHDMRQPLHIIFTECEMLELNKDLSEPQNESVSTIVKNARRLKFLINDILDYQRLIGGVVDLDYSPINTEVLTRDLAQHMQDAALEGNNKLVVECDYDGVIFADHHRIERVLVNLLSNACKFTQNGIITLSTRKVNNEMLEFCVTDTGKGITLKQQSQIFEPLMALRTPGHDGTGLGLFICKKLVECMNGSIEFKSQPGNGTTFKVHIPLLDQPLKQSAIPTPSAKQSPLALIVDDNEDAHHVLSEVFKKHGYRTINAFNGEQALSLTKEYHPDIITLDVLMDEMDGWEVLAELKKDSATEDIPVIMVTVVPENEKGCILGAEGFVSKPIKPSLLSSVILKYNQNQENGKILIVDDDKASRGDIRRMLESKGWAVSEAQNGMDALNILKEENICLLLIDLYMPEMDGFSLVSELKTNSVTSNIPIIILSAMDLNEMEQSQLKSQVDSFFGKGGLDLAELNNEISRLVLIHAKNKVISHL
ncbi:MAG: hypothetical protein CME32_12615 [Gimesia sp.]|nr:hypothetical protein [Gimesia sp.]